MCSLFVVELEENRNNANSRTCQPETSCLSAGGDDPGPDGPTIKEAGVLPSEARLLFLFSWNRYEDLDLRSYLDIWLKE